MIVVLKMLGVIALLVILNVVVGFMACVRDDRDEEDKTFYEKHGCLPKRGQ